MKKLYAPYFIKKTNVCSKIKVFLIVFIWFAFSNAYAREPRTLYFSPEALSFTVVQNGTTPYQSSTLSANNRNPSPILYKSSNSKWLVLPSGRLGTLWFGINASGLAPGVYTSTVIAYAFGFNYATLKITLTVTALKKLSFSPTSLNFTAVQNETTSNQFSTLSANSGTPSVLLTPSPNSSWLTMPAATFGSLAFGIKAAGLAPGAYSAMVVASATGYQNDTLRITLAVTVPKKLFFSPVSLNFSVIQNGSASNKFSTLSASIGAPPVILTPSANTSWLVMPAAALGSLSFGINASRLAMGAYSAIVVASATGYENDTLRIRLAITSNSPALNIKVNFQDSTTIPPVDWICDFGQPYGSRTSLYQGNGYSFGWLKKSDSTPIDLTKNGRLRTSPSDILLATFMHMQGNDVTGFAGTPVEGIWQAKILNGKYDVTVSAGEDTKLDSKHSINVEGVNAISLFVPTSTQKFKTATVTVSVSDGFLTIDATGGTNTKINYITIQPARPAVVSVNPKDSATGVSVNSSISTNLLKLPNGGINNNTITSASVYLTEDISGTIVPSNVNGTGGGDGITLAPLSALQLNTTYKFYVTAGVKDLSGASFMPYTSTFSTGSNSPRDTTTIQFDKVKLPNTTGQHSSLIIGPDGKLYALSIDGIIKRFSINADGTLGTPQLIYSLQDAYGPRTKRLAIGLAFDPSATATNLVAWITHSTYQFTNGPDWDGRLSKLSGANFETVSDVLINLPRSAKDHLSNSIAFGPDGALYFTQGSNSAMGKADATWNNREEHLLSCAVLRLDVSKLGVLPLSVKTAEGGGTYNPYIANAPLTIYASGVRNAYDLVWHSNGSLYTPTNGSAAGGNTPASVNGTLRPDGTTYNGPSIPALTNVTETENDYLFKIVQGGFYGHPNPQRGQYVMNGGNPTAGVDNAEVTSYPVGTLPDANWRGNVFDFKNNASPDGAIEYKSNVFNGALKGKLLIVRYSQHDDIIVLTPGLNNNITSYIEGNNIPGFSGFADPLDLTEDVRNGNIYVSEYGGDSGKITLLRPNTTSTAVKQIAKRSTANPEIYNTFPSCDDALPQPASANNSNVLSENKELAYQQIKIHPNPVQKKFNLEFPKTYQGDFTIDITDMYGKSYEVTKTKMNDNNFNMMIDISKLSLRPGIYFLKISSKEKKTEVLKIILL